MPANTHRPAPPPPASPRNLAKYTNKDGSKFITVPKGATPSDSSQPSTPILGKAAAPAPPDAPELHDLPAPTVNRKKQKRRQKAAAKAAAAAGIAPNGDDYGPSDQLDADVPPEDLVPSDDEVEYTLRLQTDTNLPSVNGHHPEMRSKKNKKKKKKGLQADLQADSPPPLDDPADYPSSMAPRGPGMSRDKIWSTSNAEERERIKEFWLGLGEDERKSLVKVEKDAVLKKMKEQQKHTCSCTVCGRKRTAIEEELEGLYDAYYLELEQFANQGEGPPMLPPHRDFPMRPPRGLRSGYPAPPPSRGRILEHVGDDDDLDEIEEVYSDDELEDEEYSDDEPPEEFPSPHDQDVADFLTFGNSLQVKGGILTVADDLLKNDGKRFIEMMEQLAERRMAREEDAQQHFSRGYGHPNGSSYSAPHNHPPPEEDDYDEEEDEDEDYEDSQDEEYDDEEDQMTEEQRMEEGRRMFQIFAARMFEQRVLSAYKEKVAKERQQKLLEELEEESKMVDQQKAKKAKNAQKKKDKAAQKKQAAAEDKARKEAEKAAEEAARLQAAQKLAAEQKLKAEEKRRQKEAQRKAEEEARLKKEADRQRRIHEQKEKQAEAERKAREAKDKEKKLKEEARLKDKEAREQREREAQERKEKQERDKRDKSARAAKAQKDAQEAKEAKEAKEKAAREEKAAAQRASVPAPQPAPAPQPPVTTKRNQQSAMPVPTVLPQHPANPASFASPKVPVATPVIPKAPTPYKARSASQQHDQPLSQAQSAPGQSVSPHSMTPASEAASPVPLGLQMLSQQRKTSGSTPGAALQGSQSVSPSSVQSKGSSQPTPFQIPGASMQGPPGFNHHQPPPGFPTHNRMSHDPMFPPGFRPNPPSMMMPPPGMNGPGARGFPPMPMGPPGFAQGADQFSMGPGFPIGKDGVTHQRQGSASFDASIGQPIGRPAPIGRPGSIAQGRSRDDDEDTKHLGSRALLDDDEPLTSDLGQSSLRQPLGPRAGGFGSNPFVEPGLPIGHSPWGPPGPPGAPTHQFPPPGFGAPGWGVPSAPPGFGSSGSGMGSIRSAGQPRHIAVRLMLCQACKDLSGSGVADTEGYIDLATIKMVVDQQSGDSSITEQDLLDFCDTEGSASNGGGTFDVRRDASGAGKHVVRWVPDSSDAPNPQYRAVGAPGEIGSPLTGHATLRGM